MAKANEKASNAAASWMPLDDLKPWGRNPRRHRLAELAASIRRFGFGAPILARLENRQVVAGHGRLSASRTLVAEGAREGDHADVARVLSGLVPVRLLELGEDEASALALADNQLGGAWEDADLRGVLRDLDSRGVELEGLGWDEGGLAALLAEAAAPPSDMPPELGEGLADGLTLHARWTLTFDQGNEIAVREALDALKAVVPSLAIKESEAV